MNEIISLAIITSGYFPVPAIKGGAIETLIENLINENEKRGLFQFTIFSSYDKEASIISESYKYTNVIFIKIPGIIKIIDLAIYHLCKDILKKHKSMSYRYVCQRLVFIFETAIFLRKNNYDKVLLENHSSLYLVLKLFRNAEKYKGRYYYHLHNVVTNDYKCLEIIKGTKSVIGVSNYILDTFRNFIGPSNIDYRILRNCVDRDKFNIIMNDAQKAAIRKKYNILTTDRIILFTGRLNEEKGIRELLYAFKKVAQMNVKLLVVGAYYYNSGMSSPFEDEIQRLLESESENVIFTGFVPYDKIPELYAISDIVVIPSMWDDPAPLTVIEALTSGKPLITTESGGIPEYANENCAIILGRDNIITTLSQSIDDLLHEKDKCNKLSERAFEQTRNWNVETYFNDFFTLMNK